MIEIQTKLQVFSFAKLQGLVTLFKLLKREKISLRDVENYIKNIQESWEKDRKIRVKDFKEKEKRWNKGTRKCPVCRKPLAARPITIPEGRGNLEGYTCHWYCNSENCNFEEYTHEDFKETYQKIMGEGR